MNRLFVIAVIMLALTGSACHAVVGNVYRYDRMWGSQGSGNTQLNEPMGVNIYGTTVYVADKNNNRIVTYTRGGTFLGKCDLTAGVAPLVQDIILDAAGNRYVTDTQNSQIAKLAPDWTPLYHLGSLGSGDGEMDCPIGMCIGLDGKLYVADDRNNRIAVWNLNGTWVKAVTLPGEWALERPRAIHQDGSGNFWICDTSHSRVVKVSSTFTPLLAVTGFSYPYSLAVSGSKVFVADTSNHRIVKLDLNGHVLGCTGSSGSGPGQFSYPADVAVDAAGLLYVTENGNHRVQRLKPNHLPTKPTSATISPLHPADHRRLNAAAGGSTDGDSDSLIYHFAWQKSNSSSGPWTNAGTGASVGPAATTVGEYWRVKARAWDGYEHGPWRTSTPVHIIAAATVPALTAVAESASFGRCAVTISLSAPAAVSFELRNLAGRVVKLVAPRELSEGLTRLNLSTASDSGTRLPAGRYLLTVSAAADDGTQITQVVPLLIN